ncbi:MAG: Sulfur carrier protein ThiS [Nitrosopumilales archaeon]|nr:MAG: Sulfur carrier protein ThiS [Nitrosopumilales archaeon]
MFTVKLLGGAKKSLAADTISINEDTMTVSELIKLLQKRLPKGQESLDTKNLLIAINGVDSSALNGVSSIIKTNDVITIIPIIHGGSKRRIQFTISHTTAEIIKIQRPKIDSVEFLTRLRKNYPKLAIQAIAPNYILNVTHAKKLIAITVTAKENNAILSNKIETDIIMRFAGTTQIEKAIKKVGIYEKKSFIIISIGKRSLLDKLFLELKSMIVSNPLSTNNSNFLKKEFTITTKQLKSVLSKTPLEDLLAEKAALLFR